MQELEIESVVGVESSCLKEGTGGCGRGLYRKVEVLAQYS